MADLAFGVVVLLLFVVASRRPGAACGYTLAGFGLEQCAEAFVPIAGQNSTLTNYLLAGAILLGLLRQILRDGIGAQPVRLPAVLMLLLLGYCYLSVLWSVFPSVTERYLLPQLPYLVVFVGLAPLLIRRASDLQDCMLSLLLCTFFALTTLLLFAEWGGRSIVLPYQRGPSNPLVLAQCAGSMLIALALTQWGSSTRLPLRITCSLAVLLVCGLVFLRTGSRGQIVAAVATTILFVGTRKGGAWLLLAALGLAGVFASGLFADELARNAARWDPARVSQDITTARVGRAEQLLAFWSHSNLPTILLGLGHASSRDPRLLGGYPHVVPAEVLAEEGVLGALLYVLTLGTAAFYYLRGLGRSRGRKRELLRAGLALTFYEFLLTLKQGSLLGQPSFLLLVVLSGVALEDTDQDEEDSDADRKSSSVRAEDPGSAPRLIPTDPPSLR